MRCFQHFVFVVFGKRKLTKWATRNILPKLTTEESVSGLRMQKIRTMQNYGKNSSDLSTMSIHPISHCRDGCRCRPHRRTTANPVPESHRAKKSESEKFPKRKRNDFEERSSRFGSTTTTTTHEQMGKITSTQSRNDRSKLSDVGAQQQTVRQFFLKARFIPGPYFTYILRAHFSYKSALHSFSLIMYSFLLCDFLAKRNQRKSC